MIVFNDNPVYDVIMITSTSLYSMMMMRIKRANTSFGAKNEMSQNDL